MAVTAPTHLEKQPGETRGYTMDFAALMATSETIEASSPAPAVTSQLRGEGATDLTISGVAVSGQTVTMTILGGVDRKVYRVEVTITTSTGQILVGDGMLKLSTK